MRHGYRRHAFTATLVASLGLLAAGPAHGAEVVVNGGFESPLAPAWSASADYGPSDEFTSGGGPYCGSCSDVHGDHAGANHIQFGAAYNHTPPFASATINHSGSLTQAVTIPPGGSATLRFYVAKDNSEGASSFSASIDGVNVFTDTATADAGYTLVTRDLTAYADGQSHELAFSYVASGSATQDQWTDAWSLDDVSIDVQPFPDGDGDGTPDKDDNCASVPNPNQLDTDGDSDGDVCDDDDDGDLVLDAGDECPTVPAPVAQGGCPLPPTVERTLTLKYKRGAFRGTLSPSGRCAVEQQVKVFRKRPGKDKRIGGDRTNPKGKYVVGAARRDGAYYAAVKESEDNVAGRCLAAKSKRLKLG